MSILQLFWSNRRVYFILLIASAIFVTLIYLLTGPTGAAFAGVAIAAIMVRDIGYFRRSVSLWPVLREVLDWKKIEELMAGDPSREP